MGAHARLHVPVLLLTVAVVAVGFFQLMQLGGSEQPHEVLFFFAASGLQAALYGWAVALVLAPLGRWLPGPVAACAWSLALVAGLLPLAQWASRSWFSQDLTEGLPLFYETFRDTFSELEWQVQLFALAVPAGVAASFVAVALLHRTRFGDLAVRWRTFALVGAALAISLGAERWAGLRAMGEKARESERAASMYPVSLFWSDPGGRALATLEAPAFRRLPDEREVERQLQALRPRAPASLPNVVLVVVDSLRADVIDDALTPHLAALRRDALPIDRYVSTGNCTHVSWYSLFFSEPGLFWWNRASASPKPGSPALRALRALGYRVHVLVTESIDPFGMKPSIFGDGAALVDRFDGPEEIPGDSIAEKDARAVDRVVAALGSEAAGGGHLFVVALNAAHWRYQWGPDFAPVVPDFRTFVSVQNTFTDDPRSRAMLFARYKNAVAYLDGLVGRLVAGIDDRGARDRTLLAVVGDHGEEFGEHGQVTHCSALVGPQLAPALLFRIPGDRARAAHPAVASHLDILPTIFDALDVGSGGGALYRGTSLLAAGARRPPVSVQTSAREPQRFRVLDGDVAAQFELVRPWSYKRELHTPKLRLLELTDAEGHGLPAPPAPDALARRLLGPDGADLLEPAATSERQAASRPAAAP